MRHPLLYIGLIGFDAAQRLLIAEFLQRNAQEAQQAGWVVDVISHPIWEVVDYREADALIINGDAVDRVQEGVMYFDAKHTLPSVTAYDNFAAQVHHFDPRIPRTQEPLALALAELRAPCALKLAHALKQEALPSNWQVDTDLLEHDKLLRCIQRFETVLRPLRSIYALAAELIERRSELNEQHCYHVEHEGTLDAVVDVPQRRVKLRPGVRPVDVEIAMWRERPAQANFAPPDFLTCHMEEVAWMFAMHSPAFELPKRYQRKAIHLRRMPRVRPSMLYQRHSFLLETLSAQPCYLNELQELVVPTYVHENPGQEAKRLERDLYALYLCRAISTQALPDHLSSATGVRVSPSSEKPTPMEQTQTRLSAFKATPKLNTMTADL